jgi:hypothetical protein
MFAFPDNVFVDLTAKAPDGTAVPLGLTIELLPYSHDAVFRSSQAEVKKARKSGDDFLSVVSSIEAGVNVLSTAVVGWTVTDPRWNDVFKKLGEQQTPAVEWDSTYSKDKALAFLSYERSAVYRAQLDAALKQSQDFFVNDSAS